MKKSEKYKEKLARKVKEVSRLSTIGFCCYEILKLNKNQLMMNDEELSTVDYLFHLSIWPLTSHHLVFIFLLVKPRLNVVFADFHFLSDEA
jgi:hypothetical protein